jgi:chromosome partitioning protein
VLAHRPVLLLDQDRLERLVNTAIGRDVAGALPAFGFPVSDVALCQRVIYAESAARGLAVTEAEPASEAAREITRPAQSLIPDIERKAA